MEDKNIKNTTIKNIELAIDVTPTFSLAAQQNSYPILKSIRISYPKSDEQELQPLNSLKLNLSGINDWLEEESWHIDRLEPGQSVNLKIKELRFPFEKLYGITEEISQELSFKLLSEDGEAVAEYKTKLNVLPANYWGGEERQPALLAAFVKPNGVYVESLVRKVALTLEQAGYGRSVDGYQSNTRDKPYLMLAALWNVIFQVKLAYVSPPKGFAKRGQRVRLAADISHSRMAACLDSSLLFASCIEAMGLNPVIAVTQEHAFAGAWLIDEKLPILTNDDPQDVRKRVDNRDLVLFETTLVTNDSSVTFEQARDHARGLLAEELESQFVMVIDVAQARTQSIKPLSTVEEKKEEKTSEEDFADLELPVIPPLPPVRKDEQVVDDTPETRIDTWSRKLLDLTKKNRLLNFNDRAIAIKLYCPDIAAMEDMLADGTKFKFQSAQESPYFDASRDSEMFRLQTGSDVHREYALNQIRNKVLIANQPTKKLDKNSVELFRKAKNDLEEGGSNTLFLALGFLKWKENPEDSRSYKAPLLLVPVKLTRRSARAPVYVEQLQEEDPIFNLTLIEFLQSEHDINLSEFKEELPEDDSGVDVLYVWQRVRDAVKEQAGFELVEELVLGSFSFAKYLMWKDLRDRLDDLKQNPFVKHLVDNPRDPYPQESTFIERDEIDKKLDPASIYTPLNCDSSQLVAVDASARAQDFVLEGPPGTGKSETIANIIAHNIGLGRKVLFVAEKMAALNVVYRRLEKAGLDHLCLELHSNKANKRAVLDQLNKAWQKREGLNPRTWETNVAELKKKKELLNNYVRALHAKSIFGLTARDTISALAINSESLKVKVNWQPDIEAAPISSEEDLNKTKELIGQLALAFSDVRTLNIEAFVLVTAVEWSNVWQSRLLSAIDSWKENQKAVEEALSVLLPYFSLEATLKTVDNLESIGRLNHLADFACKHDIAFAIDNGAKERIAALREIANLKMEFDAALEEISHGVTSENVSKVPVEHWHKLAEEAKNGWLKSFFRRRKINSEAVALGLSKIDDLSIIEQIANCQELKLNIEDRLKIFEKYSIWSGWKTRPESLEEMADIGDEVRDCVSKLVNLTEDPTEILIPVKKWFIDGREFLEDSKVYSALTIYNKVLEKLQDSKSELNKVGLKVPSDAELSGLINNLSEISSHSPKLKSWCEWQSAKQKVTALDLQSFSQGLESGVVSPEELSEQFRVAFCQWLAPLLIDAKDELRQFKASTHEQTIETFKKLDERVAKITSEYIVALVSETKPVQGAKDNPRQFGVLAKELQKKTRHIPIRALINQLGNSLLDLSPCLMMSPLSVAQFLPSDFKGFDLVVFDEASQMTTWDSVGAIARGKNVIIVGDPKQMPPTNFFSAGGSSDDPDEEDLESILDQALAARLPLKRLMGHYRSKHETLIAFSNSKYYENSLVTYPSSETKESAVSLHRVDGIYAKGTGRNNPIEAKAIVDEIVRRLLDKNECKKSIGVVTLNTDQQRTIEDLLDDARRQHSAIEEYFQDGTDKEPVFVKNLESVQGDERDIIMLSLAYGPTEPGAKTMSMNFGPLNKSGGERRLNVAITRATTEIVVFSSFDASMIDLSRTNSIAVEHLKHFLEFAEKGPIALAEIASADHGVDQFDSDFEEAVAQELRVKGWKIQTQVGVSKFRVDLGVLHPDRPGKYIAGIECDGATYHGSPAARDRDRVRQIILESLGWNIVRLWSTDYFVDSKSAIEKIDLKLREILEAEMEKDTLEEAEAEAAILSKSVSISSKSESAPTDNVIPQDSDGNKVLHEQTLNSADYFKPEYAEKLAQLAKEVLTERPGITLHSLALELADLHGLAKTSKKQVDYLRTIVEQFAGIKENEDYSPTLWSAPEKIVNLIEWRGVEAFGYDRKWSELAYEEALGLAKFARSKDPNSPVEVMCEELKLKRRHETTVSKFNQWLRQLEDNT
ncbi:DUF4011 domain-containing protein [Idiomarina sp. M1R2S28]|uniref:DUF4011 domain-containing protein n=1 Tax=Idiomarina rhizosphaerae TaxID=2961572 RepID=A0A9X2JSH8_9GAMM|nr:DUF4011 domain-containing protein [Idiomarina rhizosphaerae]MCP1339269.1 DUF4011 domain-containing protein [Idiomarina rhizosphaerae]